MRSNHTIYTPPNKATYQLLLKVFEKQNKAENGYKLLCDGVPKCAMCPLSVFSGILNPCKTLAGHEPKDNIVYHPEVTEILVKAINYHGVKNVVLKNKPGRYEVYIAGVLVSNVEDVKQIPAWVLRILGDTKRGNNNVR